MKICSVCQKCYEDTAVSCSEENHSPLVESPRGSCETIAGYRLEFLIETNAAAEVFRARQTASGQSCLVKILAAEANKESFLREAKIAAAFAHPNVAEVYEAGVLESGEIFVVAEDAEGQTLRGLLRETGAPTLVNAVRIARQTTEALHAIHLQGLTHRAVRPENIILTTDAENRPFVKLRNFDFGGVHQKSIAANRFLSESDLNALKYFAPEQFTADAAGDAQTDVYALGIVFYELLAGAPPFDAPKAALLIEKHKNETPPEIRINNFDLRMLLTHTLTEALRKPSRLRHKSANAFARQLRHIEQLATHSPTPPPALSKFADAAPVKKIQKAAIEKPEKTFAGFAENSAARFENEPRRAVEAESKTAALIKESESIISDAEIETVSPADLKTFDAGLTKADETVEFFTVEPTFENFSAPQRAPVIEMPPADETTENTILPAAAAESAFLQIESSDTNDSKNLLPAAPPETTFEFEQPEDDAPPSAVFLELHSAERTETRNAAGQFPVDDFSLSADFSADDDFSAPPEEFENSSVYRQNADKTERINARDAIFSSYAAPRAYSFPIDRRSLFVSGGFAGLLILFLALYLLTGASFEMNLFGEPETAKTAPAKKSLPQFETKNAASPAQTKTSEVSADAPTTEDEADLDRLRPLTIDERTPAFREAPPVSAAKPAARNPMRKNAEINRNEAKPSVSPTTEKPVLSSTIVIFPENGKIKSRIETAPENAAGKSSPTVNQNDDFSRPRIVKNPKP